MFSKPAFTANSASSYQAEESRPGVEGRLQYWHSWGETGRLEIAGGIHSEPQSSGFDFRCRRTCTPWIGSSGRSRSWSFPECFSMAGMCRCWARFRPATIRCPMGEVIPVRSNGGWAQMRIPITSRLAFNVYGGNAGAAGGGSEPRQSSRATPRISAISCTASLPMSS